MLRLQQSSFFFVKMNARYAFSISPMYSPFNHIFFDLLSLKEFWKFPSSFLNQMLVWTNWAVPRQAHFKLLREREKSLKYKILSFVSALHILVVFCLQLNITSDSHFFNNSLEMSDLHHVTAPWRPAARVPSQNFSLLLKTSFNDQAWVYLSQHPTLSMCQFLFDNVLVYDGSLWNKSSHFWWK